MHTSELNNFIIKFCKLWQAGVTANLHVETRARMAWCQVRAKLGHAPAPAHLRPQAQRQPGLRRRRGPAHEQRKARRAAAQIAVARKEEEEAVDKKKASEEAAAKRKKEAGAEEAGPRRRR